MKFYIIFSAILHIVLIVAASSNTPRNTKKHDQITGSNAKLQHEDAPFKGFYPRPSSMEEFRSQRLYPVNVDDRVYLSNVISIRDIVLDFNLPFFGFKYTYVWIHRDGYLLFSRGLIMYPLPIKFPIKNVVKSIENDPSLIAPWLSSQEIPSSMPESGIYVRKITIKKESDVMLRERVILDFRDGMIGARDFTPTHALIVTWRNLTFPNRRRVDASLKTNTYQVVLATDEVRTYAMFNYDNIEWITHLDNYDGMNGPPAFVGFNGGNRTRAFELKPYSQSQKISLLERRGYGNNIKGRWIFQIDEEILLGSCVSEELDLNVPSRYRLTFFPRKGNMLGGTMVNVTGPCFGSNEMDRHNTVVVCRFGITDVTAVWRDIRHVSCIQPFLVHHGYVDLSVSVNGGLFQFTGRYYIQPPEMGKEDLVIKNHADISEYPTSMVITWEPKALVWNGKARASLHLWGYREPGINDYPRLTYIDSLEEGTIAVEKGFHELDPVELQKRKNYGEIDMEFGFLSMNLTVSSDNELQSPVIWSRPMPLAWYFRPQWERKYSDEWKNHFCKNWTDGDKMWIFEPRSGDLSCPCTQEEAMLDVGRFIPDSSCNQIAMSCDIFHKGAKHCVQSGRPSASGHGLLCCYDHSGELMRTTDTIYGSRPSKSHLFGSYPYRTRGNVPTLSHWQIDTMPFFFCCKWGGERNNELCQLYNERRKSEDCRSYNIPGIASTFGDPHFHTFDGLNYTFNGKGEFVLVRDSKSKVRIDIQGRFEEPLRPVERYSINATKLTAVVARVGESSVVEFRLRPKAASSRYQLFLIVDGEYYYLRNDISRHQIFNNVTIYQPEGIHNMSHIIAFFQAGVGVEVRCNAGNLAAAVYLPISYLKKTSGLLGNWSRNMLDDFTLPDGRIAFELLADDEKIHSDFGMKWRVTEKYSEDVGKSLFFHDAVPFEQFDDVNFKPKFKREILGSVTRNVIKVCGGSQNCMYDFIVTGDESFSIATKDHESRALLLNKKVTRCPPLPNPPHGFKSNISTIPGTVVLIKCNENYRLIGDGKVLCQKNGTWRIKPYKCMPKEMKDFYPQPSTIREFRSQLLYPVKRAKYFWDTQTAITYLLPMNLPFFGSTFNKFYIWGYGIIVFPGMEDSKFYVKSPKEAIDRFREEDKSIISPLFSDDNSFSGPAEAGLYIEEINVRKENNTMMKERLLLDFKEGMVGSEKFNPTYAVIITWRNSSSKPDSTKTNTFQVILATDEDHTYVMYNYDNIQNINFLTEKNGETKVAKFVGFSGPRRTRMFELEPYSQSTNIELLKEHGYGNNLNGRWFFKVDEDVQMGSCIDRKIKQNLNQKAPLSFYPHSGVMLGGTVVNVTGPCFNPKDVINCKFGSIETNAVYIDINRVMCVQPRLFHYGYIDLTVSINGKPSRFLGKYYVAPPGINKADISVNNRAEMSEYPTSMIIRWNPELLSMNRNEKASLNLWGYREIIGEEPKLTYIDTLSQVPIAAHNGSYEFDPFELQKRTNYDEIEMEFGFLSINTTDSDTGVQRVIWSTPMPLAWYFRPQWERKFKDGWKKHFCEEWVEGEEEHFPPEYPVISCPCTLEQAEADRGRFFTDASCNYIEKNCEILHKTAHHCVRYGRPLSDGSGQLCCYSKNGELIRSADSMYSGRPSRSNFYGKPPFNKELLVPSLSHWYHDIIPFFFCCKWSGENSDTCELFDEERTSADCVSYEPPGVGFVYGDPHFITFDGMNYTFNGKGEFVLVRVQNDKYSLNIQGRFEEVFYYVRKGQKVLNATKLTALVVKDGSSTVVEFRLHPHPIRARYKIDVLVDKEYFYFRRDGIRTQSFNGVTVYQPTGIYNMSHVIALFDSGAGVELATNNGNMAATIYLPTDYMNMTRGLLGKWSKETLDDFMLPNDTILDFSNVTTESIHELFGMEWRLTQVHDENKGHSLFYHDSDVIYDNPHFRPMYELPQNLSAYLQKEEIKNVCGNSMTCLFDLVATNDTTFASTTKRHMSNALLLRQTVDKPVIRCPALRKPKNGRKSDYDYHVGVLVKFACNRGYKLVGGNTRQCQSDGTWTGTDVSCIPK